MDSIGQFKVLEGPTKIMIGQHQHRTSLMVHHGEAAVRSNGNLRDWIVGKISWRSRDPSSETMVRIPDTTWCSAE